MEPKTQPQPRNRLAGETSPYLLQHADNPVDWYPWGPEALERARAEDKPILLSIGYSACHWCHVMAHESFEDEETAAVMNRLFVNIKVDREERPDLDKIYQTAHYLLTQRSGGWPLTVFLDPHDQVPFFAGTYFPREARHGLPAFKDLLHRIAEFYRNHRDDIGRQNQSLMEVLQRIQAGGPPAADAPDATPLGRARDELIEAYDPRHGGFGQAPKFPHPTYLEHLLRTWAASRTRSEPDTRALEVAAHTLRAMARGGIYDQIGGGFCRYSVDERWMIPHFEKMLYDNGPLQALYTDAWQATGDDFYARIAREIGAWVIREMQSEAGGYYSTLDADSEGEEGKYYVWTPDEVRAELSEEEYRVASLCLGLAGPANFEGRWHPYLAHEPEAAAQRLSLPAAEVRRLLDAARAKLLAARARRVPPGRDEKILTSWNALMIKGMARAGRVLREPAFIESAQRALAFVRAQLWRDGRLLAVYKDGRARFAAYLDDHANLIDAILELLQARWDTQALAFAIETADVLLEHFEDRNAGGFFFTADDHERLIQRPKGFADDATPSGNAVAAYALGRLGHLLGEPRYLDAAERTVRAAWGAIEQAPSAHSAMLAALEETLQPPQLVVLRTTPEAAPAWAWVGQEGYEPARMVFRIDADCTDLPDALAQRAARGEAVAYVCTGTQCSAPISDPRELRAALG